MPKIISILFAIVFTNGAYALSSCDQTACAFLKAGYYVGFSYGSKSGGKEHHDELSKELNELHLPSNSNSVCINGSKEDSSFAYEKYFQKRQPTKARKCSGSFGVFVGPFQSLSQAKEYGDKVTFSLMHTYMAGIFDCTNIKQCKYSFNVE